MRKTAIFVDVQNIYYTTRDSFNRQFNYRELWRQLSGTNDILVANAYAIARAEPGQEKFQSALRHIGFNVKLKPFISRVDGSAKGDWDVGITIDAIKHAPEVDHFVLLSGDGDFELLVKFLKDAYNLSVDVYGVSALTASSLKHVADKFYPIDSDLLL